MTEHSNSDRLRGMLGLAMRAGKVVIGTETVCLSLGKRDKVKLVLIACDASDATKKKIVTKCNFYGVAVTEVELDTSEMGRLLGKTYGPATVAILDDGFAREILRCAAQN